MNPYKVYKNKYGRLEFEVVGRYQKVSSVNSKRIKSEYSFTIDDAEKIALITENSNIQLSFASWTKVYLLHHKSLSMVAVCRVVSLEFDKNINATKELDRPSPYHHMFI